MPLARRGFIPTFVLFVLGPAMIFSRRLSLTSLIELCRALRHYLAAGLMLRDAFRQQAKLGLPGVRPVAARIAAELEQGHNLQHALQLESQCFPPIVLALAGVGEETGMLPEVFGELERYFVRQQGLRRQFIAATAWPILQFCAAIFVVAGFIWILGAIGEAIGEAVMPNGQRYDPLGLGLFGAKGAFIFLGCVAGFFTAMYLLYLLVTRVLGRGVFVAKWLLRLPGLGGCLKALALARFCLALRMTLESAMPIREALALSLRATANPAFVAAIGVIQTAVRKGDDLSLALERAKLFPSDFLSIIAVAESSGRFDEVLEQQSNHYHDVAGRRLIALTTMASLLVWLFVGALIIWVIFRIALTYIGLLDPAAYGL
jgi:type IV pilus assembly protein PilC